jgi:hypothetical protein
VTSEESGTVLSSKVKCRRRPGRKPCPGEIMAVLRGQSKEIIWECPVCGDNGVIHHWGGTLWDCSGRDRLH